MKRIALNALIILLLIASLSTIILGLKIKSNSSNSQYVDNVNISESSSLTLDDSGDTVTFSDVVLSKQEETRELIVSTQEATVSAEIEDRLVKQLDIDALKKSQTVTYKGTGYFVVNLETLTENNIEVDDKAHTVTIKIQHPHLKDISIDSNKVEIGDIDNGLLTWGNIEITVKDYNTIEQELQDKLYDSFNTGENQQVADDNALKMVKEVYEPVIKAVDDNYDLIIAFQ